MKRVSRMRSPEWVDGLREFCSSHLKPTSTIVEIGCFAGESTEVFAQFCGRVFAVDPWDENYAELILAGCDSPVIRDYVERVGVECMSAIERMFDERTKAYPNVVKMRMTSSAACAQFRAESVDCVYIDAIHTREAVLEAAYEWLPMLRAGGIMAGHDYCLSDWPGVVAAVDEMFGGPDEIFPDTSWMVGWEKVGNLGNLCKTRPLLSGMNR